MKTIDQDSLLNRTNLYLDSVAQGKLTSSMTTANILSAIQNAPNKVPPKPWIPKSYCQFPISPKMDDFDISKGLGHVSLQSTIDSLNHYKQLMIANIKSCLAAMGPDGSKDSKLAIQVTTFIQQVIQAASCFSQMVKNINNLVTTYLTIINLIINDVMNKITQLEQQILSMRQQFDPARLGLELVNAVGEELIRQVNEATNVFEILASINQLLNKISSLQQETTSLLKSPKRMLMNLEAQASNVQAMCNNFNYFLQLLGILKSNQAYASGMMISDSFLDDFDYNSMMAGDYSWSLTNSGALIGYNSTDDFSLLTKLTSFYQGGVINPDPSGVQDAIIIDSRNTAGTIIVGNDGDGIISGGLDIAASTAVVLVLQLSINNGQTLIQAALRPSLKIDPDGTFSGSSIGSYVTKQTESFRYQTVVDNGDGTWNLYLIDTADSENVRINDWYYYDGMSNMFDTIPDGGGSPTSSWFNSPSYNVPTGTSRFSDLWKYEYTLKSGVSPELSLPARHIFPMIFQINKVTTSYIQITRLGIPPIDQLLSVTGISSLESYYNAPTTIPQPRPPINPNPDIKNNIFTLSAYPLNRSKYPHAGEKIPCDNWTLSILPSSSYIGDSTSYELQHTAFAKSYPSDIVRSLFLKCRFGFIPD